MVIGSNPVNYLIIYFSNFTILKSNFFFKNIFSHLLYIYINNLSKVIDLKNIINYNLLKNMKIKKMLFSVYLFYNKELFIYKSLNSNYNTFIYKTKFKVNYKYNISLLYNNNLLITFGLRNGLCKSLKEINKKSRFMTNNYILLDFLNKLLNNLIKSDDYKLYFFYKNINFFNITLLKNFFKILNFFKLNVDLLFFNINFSYKPNKYYKKYKTIKKFKKKIYNNLFKKKFIDIFL